MFSSILTVLFLIKIQFSKIQLHHAMQSFVSRAMYYFTDQASFGLLAHNEELTNKRVQYLFSVSSKSKILILLQAEIDNVYIKHVFNF